ncbi:MAG: lytic transglycosylase domain-containing protein [Candidatus Gracilibacteria bacterium]|nr:lytic transglycosylase domain-containing protein [Candidatus Gracilibacteria bacterium]
MNKKNKNIIIVISVVIVLLLYFFIQRYNKIDNYLFKYPSFPINFAGEEMPIDSKHFSNKEKFDREFIVTSNTLYQFYLYIKRYPLYIPYIEKKLKENDIPDDFKYLTIVESALRNDIVSSAGAGGIWQFMPETAKSFGLIINNYVDERYNFEKSTDAAIKYLNKIYSDLNDWTLVAASYNRGENAIKNALKDQNVNSYYDLYLNEETGRYVFKILAVKYIIKNYIEHKKIMNLVIGDPFTTPNTKNITEGKIDNIVEWANKNGQSYNNVKLLNPWIKGDSLPDGKWSIKILK